LEVTDIGLKTVALPHFNDEKVAVVLLGVICTRERLFLWKVFGLDGLSIDSDLNESTNL